MVQEPCKPIRSAKGNPARSLIVGPPLRAHRTQWHAFTDQGLGLLEQVGTGPHRGIDQGQGQRPANTGTSASNDSRTAGARHWIAAY
jgi:hypothetical protein